MEEEGDVIQMPLRGATEEEPEDGAAAKNHVGNGEEQPMHEASRKQANGDCQDAEDDTRCKCCPKCCYGNNVVMVNSVVTCFAMIISVGILVGLTVTIARPHLAALSYVDGTCTTVTSNFTGQRERCNCGGRFCAADYPCLEVTVEYQGNSGEMIRSMLHDEEHVATYRSHCSYQPETCQKGRNDFLIDLYRHKWGIAGQSFPCVHNPNGEGALRRRTRSVMYIIHIILWPTLCSVISTLLCCVVYCYCCPRSRVHKFSSEKV